MTNVTQPPPLFLHFFTSIFCTSRIHGLPLAVVHGTSLRSKPIDILTNAQVCLCFGLIAVHLADATCHYVAAYATLVIHHSLSSARYLHSFPGYGSCTPRTYWLALRRLYHTPEHCAYSLTNQAFYIALPWLLGVAEKLRRPGLSLDTNAVKNQDGFDVSQHWLFTDINLILTVQLLDLQTMILQSTLLTRRLSLLLLIHQRNRWFCCVEASTKQRTRQWAEAEAAAGIVRELLCACQQHDDDLHHHYNQTIIIITSVTILLFSLAICGW